MSTEHEAHARPGHHHRPTVRIRTVVEVTYCTGQGCCAEDPTRNVVAYIDPDTGTVLAEHDPTQYVPTQRQVDAMRDAREHRATR